MGVLFPVGIGNKVSFRVNQALAGLYVWFPNMGWPYRARSSCALEQQ